MVDEPKMKRGLLGYGGVVAAPAFKNVAKQIISYLGIEPRKEEIVAKFSERIKAI